MLLPHATRFLLAVLVAGAGAADSRGSVVRETWDAAFLQGSKAGYVHTTVTETPRANERLIRTDVQLSLTVKRFGDTVAMRMETRTEETAAGRVTAVSMRQFLGKDQQLQLQGTVEGDRLHVMVDGGRRLDKRVPWSDEVVGLCGQERLFRQRRVKPGDSFTYLAYEPTVTAIVTMRVTVKDYEDVAFPGSRRSRRLLRAEALPDKIGGIQLPAVTYWLDEDRMPVHSQVEMPGLGRLALYRMSREEALRPGGGGPNIGTGHLIRLKRAIPKPYETLSAAYRIQINGDDDPATTFARDARQTVTNVRGNTFEVRVEARHEPAAQAVGPEPGPEFLKSCYFITSDDARVREHARRAVSMETDPWLKALRVEQWVYRNMAKKNFTEGFAPADRVARTLEGDCTEHAVLAAAMCRAAGIPSRAAIGLLYVDTASGPAFGFHMWVEVWVRGQWFPIDPTLGRGYVGATHLKIADHSWYDTASLTPLLPAARVVGKATIEVLRVNGG